MTSRRAATAKPARQIVYNPTDDEGPSGFRLLTSMRPGGKDG